MTRSADDHELWDLKNESRRDNAEDDIFVCSWCDTQIDGFDLDKDVCCEFGGTICRPCAAVWRAPHRTPNPAVRSRA